MFLRFVTSLACAILVTAVPGLAQKEPGSMPETSAPQSTPSRPSPPATASVSLNGKAITIHYSAPSMRGRKIMGEVVPFDKVWRTGANEATTFVTERNLRIGSTTISAGSYTLYTLPGASQWLLIINKQTGQSGTVYNQDQDLVRVPMKASTLSTPQEKMSISFESTHGNTTTLHIRWENTDESVQITAE